MNIIKEILKMKPKVKKCGNCRHFGIADTTHFTWCDDDYGMCYLGKYKVVKAGDICQFEIN